MSSEKLTRAERRRREREAARRITQPDTAKGARKRRAVAKAMEEAAEEASLKLRARRLLK